MKRKTPHLNIRISPALRAKLDEARQLSGNTMTGELRDRLELTFQRDDRRELIEEVARETAWAVARGVSHSIQIAYPRLAEAIDDAAIKQPSPAALADAKRHMDY